MSRVRFEFNGVGGHTGRVYFVADDGTETEISSVITGIDFHATVGDANTATISVIKVEGTARADLADVVVRSIKRRRRRWFKRRAEVTHIGSKWREFLA